MLIYLCESYGYVVCNYIYIQCWCCWWSILLNVCVHAVWLCPFQVLLLVRASFGFEMETFEFLNILQAHGFPKVTGDLTHLDVFKNQKILKKVKKALKQCFWTEVWQVGHASSALYTQHIH